MIVFRYLAKEVFATLLSVTVILLFIFVSNQFVRYLSEAAAGKLIGTVLLRLIIMQVPFLLGLLLPLGLFLGILLAYGRLYNDNEMTVLMSCGMSRARLVWITARMALIVALVVSFLNLWLAPRLLQYREQLLALSDNASILQTLMPGRFQASQHGKQVYYVEKISRDRQNLYNIFIAQMVSDNPDHALQKWSIISAEGGYQMQDKKTEDQFLVATNGYRYTGVPGFADYHLAHFKQYGVRILEHTITPRQEFEAMPLWPLIKAIKNKNDLAYAELQWRLAMPCATFLLALLAVPLSHVKPRQGKYAKLFPAILIFMIYANMLFVARNWLEKGVISPLLGIWFVHFCLLIVIGLAFLYDYGLKKMWRKL